MGLIINNCTAGWRRWGEGGHLTKVNNSFQTCIPVTLCRVGACLSTRLACSLIWNLALHFPKMCLRSGWLLNPGDKLSN